LEILTSGPILCPPRAAAAHLTVPLRRMPPTATLPRSDEAESMHRLIFFVSPTLARCLIDSSQHFIAETGGVKLHHRPPASRLLRSTRRPIKGTPSTAARHRTSSHFLLRLSVPPLTPHRVPPLPFVPLCHRPYLAIEPVAKDLSEVPRLPLFVLKPS
jgi:hypothetical protein